jgi:futalosine hydrolase
MKLLIAYAVAEELGDFRYSDRADYAVLGVGPVEAAIALTRKLAQTRYDLVLNVGIGGGFPGVNVGSAVIVDRAHYVDLGREDASELHLPGGVALITSTPAALHLLPPDFTALAAGPGSSAEASPRYCGPGICSATITTSDERAARLYNLVPGACSESMEGFAALRAAMLAGVPALELRGISNRVGDRELAAWDFRAGAQAAQRLLHDVLQHIPSP